MSDTVDCALAVTKALKWVGDHLDAFEIARSDKPFNGDQGKHLIELAIMLVCYAELTGDYDNSGIQRMVKLLETTQSRHDLRDHLLRFPRMFGLFSDVYSILRFLGHDNAEHRELIQRVIDAGFPDHVERVPHRLMDIRLSLEWGGFRHSWPTLEALWTRSIMSQAPCALYLDEDATYALTHAIMFCYGYGIRRNVAIPGADADTLRSLLSALLVSAVQERHWDLLGELLLSWDCIGLTSTVVYNQAWQAFLAVQKEDGAFPGPDRMTPAGGTEANAASANDSAKRHFHSYYHTTIVAIMAGALHINRARSDAPSTNVDRTLEDTTQRKPREATNVLSHNALASKVEEWLEQLMPIADSRATTPAKVFYEILLGCWICDSAMTTGRPPFSRIAERIYRVLLAREGASNQLSSDAPPALRLVASALLVSEGYIVPALYDFLLRTAEILETVPADERRNEAALLEKRVLLHSCGLHSPLQPVLLADEMAHLQALALPASESDIEDLVRYVNVVTHYGTRAITLPRSALWLREMLVGFVVHFFREYNLVMGCKLLRSMCYLGIDNDRTFDACIKFIALHQRPEGAFGFFGPEEAGMKAALGQTFSPDLDLYLPVTIDCLWTLAEAGNSRWRLYDSLRHITPTRGTIPAC